MCREITSEECLKEFLGGINFNIHDIAKGNQEIKIALEKFAFGLLCIIDGVTNSPAIDLVINVDEGDKQYHVDEGSNYYKNGMCFNHDVYLHEMFKNHIY